MQTAHKNSTAREIHFLEIINTDSLKDKVFVAGIDEVAVSPLAGPMISCLVAMPKKHGIPELPVDSKKLSEAKIAELAEKIEKVAYYISFATMEATDITISGTHKIRLKLNKRNAIEFRKLSDVKITLDGGETIDVPKVVSLKQAEGKNIGVSAASILAKHRTNVIMNEFHEIYPLYNFKKNKGYETEEHLLAIHYHGLCEIHRTNANYGKKMQILVSRKRKVSTTKKEKIDLQEAGMMNRSTWEFVMSELNKTFGLQRELLGPFGFDFFSNVRTKLFDQFTDKMKNCLLKIYFETQRRPAARKYQLFDDTRYIWFFDEQKLFQQEINIKTTHIIQQYSVIQNKLTEEDKALIKNLVKKKTADEFISVSEIKAFRNLFNKIFNH